MLRATIKSLFARKLRLILTALAVVLGVGMTAGSFILTDTALKSFDDLFGDMIEIAQRFRLAGEMLRPIPLLQQLL